MWIKIYDNQITFTVLKFSNITISDPPPKKKMSLKFFWKGKIYKIPSEIQTHDIQICS